jgi:hypothetical protein
MNTPHTVGHVGWSPDYKSTPTLSQLKGLRPSDTTPCSAGWNAGTAPKDGKLYVAIGRVVWAEKYGGGSSPFTGQVKYRSVDGGMWVDQDDMAIAQTTDDIVHIDHWISLPNPLMIAGRSLV